MRIRIACLLVASTPAHADDTSFIERRPGAPVVFRVGGEDLTIYGNLDVSVEDATKGFRDAADAVGDNGWMPAISTNLSYVGIRGSHALAGAELALVYQLETGLDISATAGTPNTNSNSDSIVKGALTSRDTYLGLAGASWGSVKVGKIFAPYRNSTSRMNPFLGMIGDYAVIMGNSGGDNRVEFGTRLDHAVVYESPRISGVSVDLLVSPGQNRADDNSLIAAGESSCTGNNIPGSGALSPQCNDGSFGTAYSADIRFELGPIYATAAYELHRDVNRVSDLENDPRDIGNERAIKLGALYTAPTDTAIGAVVEQLHRTVPSDLEFQNERSRSGYWLVVTQKLPAGVEASAGWAHANASPGDPGQHNTMAGANPDNAADMLTIAFRHAFDRWTSVYADAAMTWNHRDAHFDLGAGGRAVTTDCHDASQLAGFDPITGMETGVGPRCYAGGHLAGFSVGIDYRF